MGLRCTKIVTAPVCKIKTCNSLCTEYKRTDTKIYWNNYCSIHKCLDSRCKHHLYCSGCEYIDGICTHYEKKHSRMTADAEERDAIENPWKY